jgi:TonB family protein
VNRGLVGADDGVGRKTGNVKAKCRGARWSVILGSAVIGLVVVAGLPPAAVADVGPSAEDLARFRPRYQGALSDLWSGKPREAGTILGELQDSEGLRPIIEKGEAVIGDYQRLAVIDRKYPQYTIQAKREGTEGQILIRALIDVNGKVTDTEVLHGLPNGLTEEALKALRKSRFQPATLNGEPVGAIYHQSVDMKLTPAIVSQRRIGGGGQHH